MRESPMAGAGSLLRDVVMRNRDQMQRGWPGCIASGSLHPDDVLPEFLSPMKSS